MRLIPDVLNAFAAPRLAEGDPLPPDDRVAVGSVLALNDLYQTQAPRLLRYFARRADSQDAGDLVQESFARLADASAATNRTIEQPEAYLNRIATNLLRNRAKTALQRSLARPAQPSANRPDATQSEDPRHIPGAPCRRRQL
jgi:DNA-directed RNA polymerase specialized sigma24 family protein